MELHSLQHSSQVQPRQLFNDDLDEINTFLNDKDYIHYFTKEDSIHLTDISNFRFYISPDNKDMIAFEIIDDRLHYGHNMMKGNIKTGMKNVIDIFNLHYKNYPYLDYIIGLTPLSFRGARLITRKLGFKDVSIQYNNDERLCYRYELRRNEWKWQD